MSSGCTSYKQKLKQNSIRSTSTRTSFELALLAGRPARSGVDGRVPDDSAVRGPRSDDRHRRHRRRRPGRRVRARARRRPRQPPQVRSPALEPEHFCNVCCRVERLSRSFDPNPLERHTFWTLFLGGTFMVLTIYAANQSQIQRYLSCKDLRTAQLCAPPLSSIFGTRQSSFPDAGRASGRGLWTGCCLCARSSLWFNMLAVLVILFMWASLGMVAYAYYFYCDPLLAKRIQRPDQVLAVRTLAFLRSSYLFIILISLLIE